MNITIIGTGYVGLVTGACLADLGNNVFCLDIDQAKIDLLNSGGMHSYEPGLKDVIARNVEAGRLTFLTDVAASVAHGSVQFIAVGTPPDEDGSADLQYVLAAARNIGRHMTDFKVVVDKSTVPVGTADKVSATIQAELAARFSFPAPSSFPLPVSLPLPLAEGRGEGISGSPFPAFSVVSNSEFLKEGAAVEDFTRPDRIVLGVADDVSGQQALAIMRQLYAPFNRNNERTRVMDVKSAEFTKYAANAMLATRISFMNELADQVGADIELVRHRFRPRIGYMYAGTGSTAATAFPRTCRLSPASTAKPLRVLEAVEAVNNDQKLVLVNKVFAKYGRNLSGKTFALWGLAFKPDTKDMREAPSRVVIIALLRAGARIVAHDPVAEEEARRVLAQDLADAPALLENLQFADKPMEAVQNAHAPIIVTEWKAYRSPNWAALKAVIKTPVIFDGRNLYEPNTLRQLGISYDGVGRLQ